MRPRQQGDAGELSAMEWLVGRGASVCYPIGHAPDVDLVAWWDGRWAGVVKRFSADRCDFLFIHVGEGRRWFIPAGDVAGGSGLLLGGPRYERFEVEPGRALPGS